MKKWETYLETRLRTGRNEVGVLIHLCVGAPCSVGDSLRWQAVNGIETQEAA